MSAPFSPTTSPPIHNPKVPLPRAPDPRVDPAAYLRSIGAVRERCGLVLEKARNNQLNHFIVDMSKFNDTVKFVVSVIKVSFVSSSSSLSLLIHYSVTLRPIIPLYLLTVAGNTSMLVARIASPTFSKLGHLLLTHQRELGVSSISFLCQSFLTPVQEHDGHTSRRRMDAFIDEAKVLQWRA